MPTPCSRGVVPYGGLMGTRTRADHWAQIWTAGVLRAIRIVDVFIDLVLRAAMDGVGVAFVDEDRVEARLGSRALLRVLEDWCQPYPGFFLYYPSRKQQPAALSAFIDTLRI